MTRRRSTRFRDARTISAISVLRHDFPYAATLLAYVVTERILKRYVADHWRDRALRGIRVPLKKKKTKQHAGRTLDELRHLTKSQRLEEVLCHLTLGEVEALLDRPENDRCTKRRNDVMHSNLYLTRESRWGRARQQAKNEARFAAARADLALALSQFTDDRLVEVDDVLTVQSKDTVE